MLRGYSPFQRTPVLERMSMKAGGSPRSNGTIVLVLLMLGCLKLLAEAQSAAGSSRPLPRRQAYSACATCADCHDKIYGQHVSSMHARSFSNPVFQAQYVQDLLPGAAASAGAFHTARSCTACHAPVAHRLYGPQLVPPALAEQENTSVTCDFCHTITGYRGDAPGNANYHTEPGETKYGPFQTRSDWHHHYSELQTRSEFCAICHNVRNQSGLEIKSTYDEWRKSRHARDGITCQDCHMSVNGFLNNGQPVHDSGPAASMTLGWSPDRSQLYTHRFHGARSRSQVQGAVQLAFKNPTLIPGSEVELEVVLLVDNSRTGHKFPSGSVELRYLWIEAYVQVGAERIELVPVSRPGCDGYDITGVHPDLDGSLLAGGVSSGHKIYRTLLSDGSRKPTLAFHEAKHIDFDNRLDAAEVREETFRAKIPRSLGQTTTMHAALYYVAYPHSFATRLGLPKAEPVQVASISGEVVTLAQ